MSLGLATRGMYGTVLGSGGPLGAPVISNITPTSGITPGVPGAFSASYSLARNTPIEFDISSIVPGAHISITAKFENRDETYVVLAQDGTFKWPFDAHCTIGTLTSEPVHVSLLPRDGWPPVPVEIKVAAIRPAVGS